MGVFRTILIIVFVYYAFKLIARFVLPFVLKHFAGKMQQKMRDQMGADPQFKRKKEGEVTIEDLGDKKKKSNNKSDIDDAEYVDFEEVD